MPRRKIKPNLDVDITWDDVQNKPSTFPPSSHNHDDRYYTETELQTSGQSQVHWGNVSNKPSLITGSGTANTIPKFTGTNAIGNSTLTESAVSGHISSTSNPHNTTASQVGLGNVTNDAQLKRAANDFTTFTEKSTPADADVTLIEDSAASYAKKKLTWSNIKATLKTYFDSLYATLSHTHTNMITGSGTSNYLPKFTGTYTIGNSTISESNFLSANRTYYVATTGSDSNDGLSPSTPFATIQKAVNVISTLHLNGYTVTIQIADGTYNVSSITLKNPASGFGVAGQLIINGNSTTPTNVVINGTGDTFSATQLNCVWRLQNFKVTSTARCIMAMQSGLQIRRINFGTSSSNYHLVSIYNAFVDIIENYTISGSAVGHYYIAYSGVLRFFGSYTCTISGTPNFSEAFLYAIFGGNALLWSVTYSGSATGYKYKVESNSAVRCNATLPGSIAGITSTGGQFIAS
jgi:hypothetical protein